MTANARGWGVGKIFGEKNETSVDRLEPPRRGEGVLRELPYHPIIISYIRAIV